MPNEGVIRLDGALRMVARQRLNLVAGGSFAAEIERDAAKSFQFVLCATNIEFLEILSSFQSRLLVFSAS